MQLLKQLHHILGLKLHHILGLQEDMCTLMNNRLAVLVFVQDPEK